MRILEILLPKTHKDRDLPAGVAREIDSLQRRMQTYVDKIADPATSAAGREFLKSRLRDDYHDLKDLLRPHGVDTFAESSEEKFEVYDRKTGEVVGGPYRDRNRARRAVDKLDARYGGYRYAWRPVGQRSQISEAVHRLPLSNEDFDMVKKLFENPIPAVVGELFLQELIIDDELNDQIRSLEETQPNRDIRPIVAEWFRRVMPDQMYRFTGDLPSHNQKLGILSPVHGYDPKMYRGSNNPITGNAYGRI